MEKEEFIKNIGEVIEDQNKGTCGRRCYNFYFIARRSIIFILGLMAPQSLKVIGINMLTLLTALYITDVKIWKNKNKNYLELLNEFILAFLTYFSTIFTQMSTEKSSTSMVGATLECSIHYTYSCFMIICFVL